jgi:hypothetical protein
VVWFRAKQKGVTVCLVSCESRQISEFVSLLCPECGLKGSGTSGGRAVLGDAVLV